MSEAEATESWDTEAVPSRGCPAEERGSRGNGQNGGGVLGGGSRGRCGPQRFGCLWLSSTLGPGSQPRDSKFPSWETSLKLEQALALRGGPARGCCAGKGHQAARSLPSVDCAQPAQSVSLLY